MASKDQIISRWRVDMRLAFIKAYTKTNDELGRCSDLPVDTGNLRSGLDLKVGNLIGNTMEATFKSTAESDQGFDYPAYLNVAPRIAPTTEKYLKFTVGGQFVTSAGFDNRHLGWYDSCWEEGELWFRNVRKSFS